MSEDRRDEAGKRPAAALALTYLREAEGVSRKKLAHRLGHANDVTVGKYERGDKPLARDLLVAYVAPIGHLPEAVDLLLAVHPLIVHQLPDEPSSPVALTREELTPIDRACLAAASSLLEGIRAELVHRKKKRKADAARREAKEIFPGLEAAGPKERRELVEIFPRYRTWAMVEKVCDESIRLAAHKAGDALEMARFALFIAERLPSWRSRPQAYAWGHVGNAQRVGNDFDAAGQSFVRAWSCWQAEAGSEPDLLPEWRLLSLEASLRRAQHRFQEALERLDRARACSGGSQKVTGRILLQKANVFEQMGDSEGALAVLDEAAPLIEGLGDPHLLFALRFNTADNLTRLERFAAAAELVPEVRSLAIEQGDELNLTRVLWLDAKTRAGQSREEEAMSLLEQVRDDFTTRRLPYDAALAALDLARLWLEVGRVEEVRELALSLAWIFDSKKIHQEALAALALFCEAAKQETATVELALRVSAEIERVRRSAPRSRD